MKKFTSKKDVAAALSPIFQLAEDAKEYFHPKPYTAGVQRLFFVENNSLTIGNCPVKKKARLSSHRQIELRQIFSSRKTEILDLLESLLSDIPPLTDKKMGFTLEVSCYNGNQIHLEFVRDGITICLAKDLASATRDLYVFLRTHENLDMKAEIEPYALNTQYQNINNKYQIWADSPKNAILRFAACNTELQKRIRSGETVECIPVRRSVDHDRVEIMTALKGRIGDEPAQPKNWVLQHA